MCELGNGAINQIYEARREELGARKPQSGDPRYGRWERRSPCDAHCFSGLLLTWEECLQYIFKLLTGTPEFPRWRKAEFEEFNRFDVLEYFWAAEFSDVKCQWSLWRPWISNTAYIKKQPMFLLPIPWRHEVESYIKAKYVDRRFVRRPSDEELRHKVVSLSKEEKRLSSSSEHLPPKPPPPTPKLRAGADVSRQSGQSHKKS